MRWREPNGHNKCLPFTNKESFKSKMSLKYELQAELTTKPFLFCSTVKLLSHITQHLTCSYSVCMKATVTSLAERVQLGIFIRYSVISVDDIVTALKDSSFLPHQSPSSGCHGCERRSTNALRQWADHQVHPPGDSSRCKFPASCTPWCLLVA